jgi:putative phosphoesterase
LTIGVVSDTHVNRHGRRRLPSQVPDLFRRFRVGLILHAGDVNTAAVLAGLAAVAPVLAVVGNNEDRDLRALLPDEDEFAVGRFRFGLIHGHDAATARQSVRRRFAGRVDCAVYGHSHIPLIEVEDGTILFNPGSATDRRWGPHFGVGLIHVSDEKIDPELVLYTDPRDLTNVRP